MHRVEFTVEPFEEGRPGPHVTGPVEALRERGYEVEFGPFGSACDVPSDGVSAAVAAVVQAAFDHGATRVNLDVVRLDGPASGREPAR